MTASWPPSLQAVLDHAARLSGRLAELEPLAHRTPLTRAWLAGRGEEIAAVLGALLEDCRVGRLTTAGATSAADAYLRALHLGLHAQLGLDPVQPCCAPVGPSQPHLRSPSPTPQLCDDEDALTYFDPRSLVDGREDPWPAALAQQPVDPLGSSIARRIGRGSGKT